MKKRILASVLCILLLLSASLSLADKEASTIPSLLNEYHLSIKEWCKTEETRALFIVLASEDITKEVGESSFLLDETKSSFVSYNTDEVTVFGMIPGKGGELVFCFYYPEEQYLDIIVNDNWANEARLLSSGLASYVSVPFSEVTPATIEGAKETLSVEKGDSGSTDSVNETEADYSDLWVVMKDYLKKGIDYENDQYLTLDMGSSGYDQDVVYFSFDLREGNQQIGINIANTTFDCVTFQVGPEPVLIGFIKLLPLFQEIEAQLPENLSLCFKVYMGDVHGKTYTTMITDSNLSGFLPE